LNIEDYRLFIAKSLNQSIDSITLQLITGDASFRRYYRVTVTSRVTVISDSYILMVSAPEIQDNAPFIELNSVFANGGIKVPQILSFDKANGYILIEDLGTTHLADSLQKNDITALYKQVIDLLPKIAFLPAHQAMKPYDSYFIDAELEIFKTWLVEDFCSLSFDVGSTKTWQQVKAHLINALEMQPKITMHRDYHSRNLMQINDDWAVIDYQDAVQGPLCYDLVSLIKDCYHVLDIPTRDALLAYGFEQYQAAGLTQGLAFTDFKLLFTLTGIQRHLKAAGIFCRLSQRDNKHGYLVNVLPTIHYIQQACEELSGSFPNLHYFSQWITSSLLPVLQDKLGAKDIKL
jgi:hypothetical protein